MFTELFLDPSCNCLSKTLECLPSPDLGVYLDVDIDTASRRILERSNKTGILPHYSESRESLMLKKEKYENMIPDEKYTILRIDANQNIDKVYSSVFKILSEICIL